jgi:serine/threonine protein kinase
MYSVYEDEESVSIVVQYAGYGELFNCILRRGKYSENRAARLFKKLLRVVNHLHQNGIVHRDLKPENILMCSPRDYSQFVLADFGLSSKIGDQPLNLRCGSPGYVAPEILLNCEYDTKADMFSAGIILFILLSGRTPFPGETAQIILERNKQGTVYF